MLDVVDPPERRDHVGVERVEGDGGRRAEARPVSAIAREIWVYLSSSVKSHGVTWPRGLPPVENAEPEETTTIGTASRAGRRPRPRGGRERVRRRRRSLCAAPEDGDGVEVGLAPDEPAGHIDRGARAHDGVEPVARGLRDRDQHGVGLGGVEDPVDARASRRATGHALQPPAPQARVVVDEADDVLAGRLAELAEQAAARRGRRRRSASGGASRSRSDERPRTSARSPKRDAPTRRMQSSASITNTLNGKSPRSGSPARRYPTATSSETRRRTTGRLACAGEAPDAPVEAEEDEREVARDEQDRQRDREDVPLVLRAHALHDAGDRRERSRRRSARSRRGPRRSRRRWSKNVRSIQPPGTASVAGAALEVGQEAGELDEQRERDQDADQRDARSCRGRNRRARSRRGRRRSSASRTTVRCSESP